MPKASTMNPVSMLKEDHARVKDLFKRWEQSKSKEQKQQIVEEVDRELRIHSKLEEEIFYPAMKSEDGMGEAVEESLQEHHVVETLLDELGDLTPNDEAYEAKFTVMMENVQHHIQEEEKEMLPEAAELSDLEDLGRRMMERKQQLQSEMMGGGGQRPPRSRSGAEPRSRRGGTASTSGRRSR